jgi:hypothetical protein
MHDASRTGELPLSSIILEPTMKKLLLKMQKYTNSSKMSQQLSMIVPYVSNGLRCQGVLKVSLTSKGWVPSPPMPSGALTLPRMKKMTMNIVPHSKLNEDVDTGERVMKQP